MIPTSIHTLILGGGLSGLAAAHELHQRRSILVAEKESVIGGLSRSFQIRGYTFDFTGHLLHLHTSSTKRLIKHLLKGNISERKRYAAIYSHGKLTPYPFQVNTYGLPERVSDDCVLGILGVTLNKAKTNQVWKTLNFQDWCHATFGSGISQAFMIPYNEKLFQTSSKKMTADWCGPFVPTPSLDDVISGALAQVDKSYGYNATFFYPRIGGIQALPEALADKVEEIHNGRCMKKIDWKNKIVTFADGDSVHYEHLITTIPLDEFLDRCQDLPESIKRAGSQLRCAGILCINIGVKRPKISDKSWIYFPESIFPFYRVGFPMNFSNRVTPKGCSSMYVEVPFNRIKGLSNTQTLALVRKGLLRAKILRPSDRLDPVQFLPISHAYVIYNKQRRQALRHILPFLERHAIQSIGRYGGWKYSFMEEAILDGQKAARNILSQSTRGYK